MPTIDITYPWTINGAHVADIDARVEFTFEPGSPDYFDKAFGNYLPGDPPSIEIESIKLLGYANGNRKIEVEVDGPDALTDEIHRYVMDRHQDAMVQEGADELRDAHEAAQEARYEAWRDRHMMEG